MLIRSLEMVTYYFINDKPETFRQRLGPSPHVELSHEVWLFVLSHVLGSAAGKPAFAFNSPTVL